MDDIREYIKDFIKQNGLTHFDIDKLKILSFYGYYKVFYNSDFICYLHSDMKYIKENEVSWTLNLINTINQYNETLKKKITPCLLCVTNNNNYLIQFVIEYMYAMKFLKIIIVSPNDKYLSHAVRLGIDYIFTTNSEYGKMMQTGLTYIKNSPLFGDNILMTNTDTIINSGILLNAINKNNQIYGFSGPNNVKVLQINLNDIKTFQAEMDEKLFMATWFIIHRSLLKTLNWLVFDIPANIYDVLEQHIKRTNCKIIKTTCGNALYFGSFNDKRIKQQLTKKYDKYEYDVLNAFNRKTDNPYSVLLKAYIATIDTNLPVLQNVPAPQPQQPKKIPEAIKSHSKPTIRSMDTIDEMLKIKPVMNKNNVKQIFIDKFYFVCLSITRAEIIKKLKGINGLQNINYTILDGDQKNRTMNHKTAITDAIARKYSRILIVEDKLISEDLITKFVKENIFPNSWNMVILFPEKRDRKLVKLTHTDIKFINTMTTLAICLHSSIFNEAIEFLNPNNTIYNVLTLINKRNNSYMYFDDFNNQNLILNRSGRQINEPPKLIKTEIKPAIDFQMNNQIDLQVITPETHQQMLLQEKMELIRKMPNVITNKNTKYYITKQTISGNPIPQPIPVPHIPDNKNHNTFANNKIVQSLWIGESLSLNEILCIMSFIMNGHEFHLYVYEPVKNIPKECIVKDANEILHESEIFYYDEKQAPSGEKRPTAFSNLFRYKLLLDKGNYWVDMDMVCIKFLNFSDPYVFSSESVYSKEQVINAGIIKCPKGCDFARHCYLTCKEKSKGIVKWGEIGPKLVSDGIHKYKLNTYVKPWYYFCPIGYDKLKTIITPTTTKIEKDWYCLHLWNELWVKNKMDKNKIYYGSIFSQLVNKYCNKYITHEIFNLELEYGKYNKSCVLFYWMPRDDTLVEEMENLLPKDPKEIYNINKNYVHKDLATADKNRIDSFINSDIYVYTFAKLLELGIIDNLHIVFGMARNDKYVYNNEPLFTNGNYYNHNNKIFLWKLNDIKSLFSFANAKMYFYKGYGNYEHFYSMLGIVSPQSIFIRYLATALPFIQNQLGNIVIDDNWIETYAQNHICKRKMRNFSEYFQKYFTKYDLLFIDSIEKANNYKKVFTNTKNMIKLHKFSLMNYNPNINKIYDLVFCASDTHPSKNWDIFYNFISYCDKNKKCMSVLIITPIVSDTSLLKYSSFKNVKTTIKKGLTSAEMNEYFNLSKTLLITFGRDANPRVMSESMSCGCYSIVLDILSDGKDIIKDNPKLGKLIKIPQKNISYEPSYKSMKCTLSNDQYNEIYELIVKPHNHSEIAETFKHAYNSATITTDIYKQIKNIECIKNRLIITLATENYSSNLNYLLSSIKHTNPTQMVIIYHIGWRDSLLFDFKQAYPHYYFEEYKLHDYVKGDIIKLKVELQHRIYHKYKVPFVWIDADSVVLKPLTPLFDKIKDNTLICYHRPYEEAHMKFAVGVIAFGLSNDSEKQTINEKFINRYYENCQITRGYNEWFYDQTSLHETYVEFESAKLYPLSESEHSICDTVDTIVYSRRSANKQHLRDILHMNNINITHINFEGIVMKYD